jgi:hypothetical protein
MKTLATALLVASLAVPASAAIVHDESLHGDLSTNDAAPTPLVFAVGSNDILGTVNGSPLDRDYITFTIPPGFALSHLYLRAFSPDNIAFSSFNSGATSFIPSGATIGSFLAGIHVFGTDLNQDLMVFFDTRSVTTNSLSSGSLGPGTYSFLIQQTSAVLQSYRLEFVLEGVVATDQTTWGKVKALYR